MKRHILLLLFFCATMPCLFAHQSENEHNSDLHNVLFGSRNLPTHVIRHKIQSLETACYLAIDYCKGHDRKGNASKRLAELFPSYSIDMIEIPGGPHHERYTHLGWDEKYYQGGKNAVSKWVFRRDKILLGTIKKICNGYGTTDSERLLFAKLCYYVHLLGDHEDNSASTASDRMMLVQRTNSKAQRCIIDELTDICSELFGSQSNTIVSKLKRIKSDAHAINDRTENGMKKINDMSKNILEILKENVPNLLKQKNFFQDAFFFEPLADIA